MSPDIRGHYKATLEEEEPPLATWVEASDACGTLNRNQKLGINALINAIIVVFLRKGWKNLHPA